ncbi:hypothetical protein SAMN05443545_11042 [Aidingimonas halophila]|uniref:Uncharacterized protein n=1 Tax=Aidingimonas halophila TaxID=574349 RepID=A0A1H3GS50_9GAMM|nr:hypothetical protein SAMN05443545_11042 [Aidingimonas halophila]
MHFADGVTKVTPMKNLSDLPISAGTPRPWHPIIARRPDHEPAVLGTLMYVHVPLCDNQGEPLQAARGDDELMSMEPGQT